jgi:hypothetical protein
MQSKIYGLKSAGVIIAGIFGAIGALSISMLVGMGSGAVGYFLGSMLGDMWHVGRIQAAIYWYLPSGLFIKKGPKSYLRRFL